MAEGPTLASLDAGHTTAADDMRAILAEAGGVEPSTPATEPISRPAETEAATEPAETGEKTAAERARDERGRFTKAQQEAADKAAAAATGDGKEKAATKPEDGEEPIEAAVDDDLEPPHDWDLAKQTEFRKLPTALKTLVLDADKNGREIAAERSRYQGIEQVMAPRRQALAMQGYTDDVAVLKAMFAYSDFIDQKPAEFIQQLMASKGLTFDNGQQAQPNGQQVEDYDDPVIKQIITQNQRLEAELNQIKQGLQGNVQAQRQQEISEAASALTAFRDERDEKGRLKHPYMSEPRIRKAMSAMLRAGLAPDHVKAYDMACRADPDVNAKIAAAAEAERERARALEARKKAEAAQRAGSSITGTPAGPSKPELSGKGAREDMYQLAAEMGFRVGA